MKQSSHLDKGRQKKESCDGCPCVQAVCLCKDHEPEAKDVTDGPTGFGPIRVRFGLGQCCTSLPGLSYGISSPNMRLPAGPTPPGPFFLVLIRNILPIPEALVLRQAASPTTATALGDLSGAPEPSGIEASGDGNVCQLSHQPPSCFASF